MTTKYLKPIITGFAILASISFSCAQSSENPLKVSKIILDNGFTVYLNEDHSEPKVYGRVVVKAGSKNDPTDATGIAHYFEHIMFKGTDKIGTIDYASEKVFLDSIVMMYDQLGATTDKKEREKIQIKINDLSIKASAFAIPNETDKLLKKYGSTELNAYTSYEQTVYHNTFPPQQIERWLEIYYERFRNPVFRLFQSELETVYEEQNMYADMMGYDFQVDMMKKIFQKHPYGQEQIIGRVEHLKNPSLSKMAKFFQDYYVANNMALILTGDFETEKVMPMIKAKFGQLPQGNVPAFDKEKYKEAPYKGREFHKVNLLPIRIGFIAYRGVPNRHADEKALDLMANILSNNAGTGLLDKLKEQNEVMEIGSEVMQFNDEGVIAVYMMPKVIGGKSLNELELIVMQKIDSLKQGFFDEDLISSLKLSHKKDNVEYTENARYRAGIIEDAFVSGFEWQDVLEDAANYDKLNKADVIRVANQYLGENRLVYFNGPGLPKKGEKVKKPPFKPIPSANSDRESEYAKSLENIPTVVPTPQFTDFKTDFAVNDIRNKVKLFSSQNQVNDIFSLNISFGVGTDTDKLLDPAADLLKELATDSMSLQQIRKAFQKIGTEYYAYANNSNFTIYMSGFDQNLEESVRLLSEVLLRTKADQKQIDKLIQNIKQEEKLAKDDQNAMDDALYNYVFYGSKSPYLDRLVAKDIAKLTTEQLLSSLKQVLNYETNVYYVGTLKPEVVAQAMNKYFPFAAELKDKDQRIKHIQPYTENLVFVCDNKKAIQSAINLYVPGEKTSRTEKIQASLFNDYFGRGMSSIVFQEIREFRSLAYGASAYYNSYSNKYPDEKGYLFGFMNTQSDKTIDAIQALDSIISFMPEKPERLDIIKQANRESVNSGKPNFRWLPYSAAYWLEEGYTEDPRKTNYEYFQKAEFKDITAFYKKFVSGKNTVYIITGNTKNIDLKKLETFGTLKKVNIKDIRRY